MNFDNVDGYIFVDSVNEYTMFTRQRVLYAIIFEIMRGHLHRKVVRSIFLMAISISYMKILIQHCERKMNAEIFNLFH
jgi:hypothetical protein